MSVVNSGGDRVAPKFSSVDEYIASFPPEVQATLQDVRRVMRAAAPGTQEAISYGIPTLTLEGRYLIYFAGWKRHISVYPIPSGDEALQGDLAPYVAAKGTLRFPIDQPIPLELIGRATAAALAARTGDQ
jgi:uncharacterized protein YdhG (YjbR/CyaY superfamily)